MKKIVASFYPTWNELAFQGYLHTFQLPEKRKVGDLSKGMKTKFALATALSHEPDLLLMDEPTSGLDPVFRREMLSVLSKYIEDGSKTVVFSTHISTDLERIADYIVYIRNGKLMFNGSKDELIDSYVLIKGALEWLEPNIHELLGFQQSAPGFEGLMCADRYFEGSFDQYLSAEKPSLDDIIIFSEEVM